MAVETGVATVEAGEAIDVVTGEATELAFGLAADLETGGITNVVCGRAIEAVAGRSTEVFGRATEAVTGMGAVVVFGRAAEVATLLHLPNASWQPFPQCAADVPHQPYREQHSVPVQEPKVPPHSPFAPTFDPKLRRMTLKLLPVSNWLKHEPRKKIAVNLKCIGKKYNS